MLKTLCPVSFRRYSSLAIFGPTVDEFTTWLLEHRYTCSSVRQRIWLLPYIESVLILRGIQDLREIEQADLTACRKSLRLRFPYLAGTTDALQEYLRTKNLLKPAKARTTGIAASYLAVYSHYLQAVRGAAASTIQQNSYTASEFLAYLNIEKHPGRLKTLTINDLEAFVKKISRQLSRASLRTIIGRLRGFLRFLAVRGEISQGLEGQIDTPRVYQEEQLPRTLPWERVQAFLKSIDRSSLVGLRDFTIFSLMATYGLRASDVVALTLEDIHWRAGKIRISQRKTGTVLELPLIDEVGTALHRYLKEAPPPPPFRQIFLRVKAPIGTLKTAAVSRAFRVWARRSGVAIPGRGSCHRIRHSYAMFLLRRGTSLKTIGDLLGHRTVESTGTYLRLAIEDLRDVALPVPAASKAVRA
jgi:site-specific recombinase XerD